MLTRSTSWNASRPRTRAVDLADEDEHRRRVGGRRVDADREVRGADRARPEAGRGPPGELAVGLGRERGATLVPRGDDPDPGRLEGVEHRQEALARDGEGDAHAGRPERGGDQLGDRRRRARLRDGLGDLGGFVGVGRHRDPSAAASAPLPSSRSSAAGRRRLGVGLAGSQPSRSRLVDGHDVIGCRRPRWRSARRGGAASRPPVVPARAAVRPGPGCAGCRVVSDPLGWPRSRASPRACPRRPRWPRSP